MRRPALVDTDDFLTASQAAIFIGVSRSTVRRAVARGYLTGWHTPGKHLRVARSTCLDFAQSLGRVDLIGRPNRDSSGAIDEARADGAAGAIPIAQSHRSWPPTEPTGVADRSSE